MAPVSWWAPAETRLRRSCGRFGTPELPGSSVSLLRSETSFELHRSTTGETGTFTLLTTLGAGVEAHGDQGLTDDSQYCYRVRAVRVKGKTVTYSAFSNTACATTATNPPVVPDPPAVASGSTSTPAGSSAVTVAWSDNSTNEDGFRVDRSTDGGAVWSLAGTVGSNSVQFQDTGLPSENEACHRVVAFNTGRDAAPSNTDCTTPPAAPTNLTGTRVDSATVDLVWTDNSGVEDTYEVWGYWTTSTCDDSVESACETGYSGSYDHLATLPANSTAYRCAPCSVDGIDYKYLYVVAGKDSGFSDAVYWYLDQ